MPAAQQCRSGTIRGTSYELVRAAFTPWLSSMPRSAVSKCVYYFHIHAIVCTTGYDIVKEEDLKNWEE